MVLIDSEENSYLIIFAFGGFVLLFPFFVIHILLKIVNKKSHKEDVVPSLPPKREEVPQVSSRNLLWEGAGILFDGPLFVLFGFFAAIGALCRSLWRKKPKKQIYTADDIIHNRHIR